MFNNSNFNELNKKFNDETYPLYPFVCPNRVTPLKKGLYRKHNAKYRGVTAKYNMQTQRYEYPLYGMFNIEENLIIVPDGIIMTESKQAVLDMYLKNGYKQVNKPPKFETVLFSEDTEEARLALENKADHAYNEIYK